MLEKQGQRNQSVTIINAEASAQYEAWFREHYPEIAAPTSPEKIKTRSVGGRTLSYIEASDVIDALNRHFAGNWHFEVLDFEFLVWNERPIEVRVLGRLTVNFAGHIIVREQFGANGVEYFTRDGQERPVSFGDPFKGAASDSLKKCASSFGIALDLYGKGGATKPNASKRDARTERRRDAGAPRDSASAPDANAFWTLQRTSKFAQEEARQIVARWTQDKQTDWAGACGALKQAIEQAQPAPALAASPPAPPALSADPQPTPTPTPEERAFVPPAAAPLAPEHIQRQARALVNAQAVTRLAPRSFQVRQSPSRIFTVTADAQGVVTCSSTECQQRRQCDDDFKCAHQLAVRFALSEDKVVTAGAATVVVEKPKHFMATEADKVTPDQLQRLRDLATKTGYPLDRLAREEFGVKSERLNAAAGCYLLSKFEQFAQVGAA